MSPSIITIDNTPDFEFLGGTNPAPANNVSSSATTTPQSRTLLLAPPSVASQGGDLTSLVPDYDRTKSTTDLQMLDRLSAGLVTLPDATYDLVLLLTGDDGARHAEAAALLTRAVFATLVPAMRDAGRLRAQDGKFGDAETREAVLAGLVEKDGGFVKVAEEEVVIPLRFGKKKNNPATNSSSKTTEQKQSGHGNGNGDAHSSAGPAVDKVTIDIAGKPTILDMAPPAVKAMPAGVGFDFGDDLDGDYDDLIDEEELMTEEDLNRPIQIPPECAPAPGKKRRACKDCTCGLAERLEAEDKTRRSKADQDLGALKLKSEDLNELDFTVQGKTGSCGSCALGDAFRCADCPYIGLPPFKPGEEVTILNNVPQF